MCVCVCFVCVSAGMVAFNFQVALVQGQRSSKQIRNVLAEHDARRKETRQRHNHVLKYCAIPNWDSGASTLLGWQVPS